MKWKPFHHNKATYDLSHLHPFTIKLEQAAKKDNPKRIYTFDVEFSLHCFTKSALADYESTLLYKDNRESRVFCFERYTLSLQLPSIIADIHTKFCSHTGKGNFFIIELINDSGTTIEYEIYFDIKKSSSKAQNLKLFIQSAYVRNTASMPYRHRTKKISFFVIAHNRTIEKPIKAPR